MSTSTIFLGRQHTRHRLSDLPELAWSQRSSSLRQNGVRTTSVHPRRQQFVASAARILFFLSIFVSCYPNRATSCAWATDVGRRRDGWKINNRAAPIGTTTKRSSKTPSVLPLVLPLVLTSLAPPCCNPRVGTRIGFVFVSKTSGDTRISSQQHGQDDVTFHLNCRRLPSSSKSRSRRLLQLHESNNDDWNDHGGDTSSTAVNSPEPDQTNYEDGWGDAEEKKNKKLGEAPSSLDRLPSTTGMESLQRQGDDSVERDYFIPIFTLVSLGGLLGAYAYETMRLYVNGELYLAFRH